MKLSRSLTPSATAQSSVSLTFLCLVGWLLHLKATQCRSVQGIQTTTIKAESAQPPVNGEGYQFSPKPLTQYMQVHKLHSSAAITSNNVTCNDGSPVGYYMRLNSHSKSWIIYLQGGGFCGSEQSCQQRWQRTPHLMSSNFWPETKSVDGILSSEPKENPYLWNANHIYVPYCSSDSWTGLSSATDQQSAASAGITSEDMLDRRSSVFSFMGSKILERVLESLYEDLPRESSLYEAKFVLLAGDSAGATGVIMNLDKVDTFVKTKANIAQLNCTNSATDEVSMQNCKVKQVPVLRGLADSGWFLDNEPYDFGGSKTDSLAGDRSQGNDDNCDQFRCGPLQSIKQAMRFWNGQVPATCAARHLDEPWRCYFGYRTYQTLKTPLFVVQWLYDEAQLMVDRIARPDSSGQWNYVHKVVNEMRSSLENVTALFAPSCFSHSLIIRKSWNQININGLKLPHVLNSWEEQSLLDTTGTAQSSSLDLTSSAPPLAITSLASPIHKGVENSRFLINSVENHSQQSNKLSSISSHIASPTSPLNSEQPRFEALVVDSESTSGFGHITYPQYSRDPMVERTQYTTPSDESTRMTSRQQQQQQTTTSIHNSARPKGRKRRRNNNNQRTRTRQRSSIDGYPSTTESTQQTPMTKESNDLSTSTIHLQEAPSSAADKQTIPSEIFVRSNHDIAGESSNNGRLGRSTLIDDSASMLSNNVPEDYASGQLVSVADQRQVEPKSPTIESRGELSVAFDRIYVSTLNRHKNTDQQFRLIDSCGWPQCNRDCPGLDSDYAYGGNLQPF